MRRSDGGRLRACWGRDPGPNAEALAWSTKRASCRAHLVLVPGGSRARPSSRSLRAGGFPVGCRGAPAERTVPPTARRARLGARQGHPGAEEPVTIRIGRLASAGWSCTSATARGVPLSAIRARRPIERSPTRVMSRRSYGPTGAMAPTDSLVGGVRSSVSPATTRPQLLCSTTAQSSMSRRTLSPGPRHLCLATANPRRREELWRSAHSRLRGRCNCGVVQFEVSERLVLASRCHCTRCKRRSGAAASANAHPAAGSFRVVECEDKPRVWKPQDGREKWFCGDCGSALFASNLTGPTRSASGWAAFNRNPGSGRVWGCSWPTQPPGSNSRRRAPATRRKTPQAWVTPQLSQRPEQRRYARERWRFCASRCSGPRLSLRRMRGALAG